MDATSGAGRPLSAKPSTKELALMEDKHAEHTSFLFRQTAPGVPPSVACLGSAEDHRKLGLQPMRTLKLGVQYAGVANRVVRAAFRDAGFRVVKGNNWNVLWGAAMAPDEYKSVGLLPYQRLNHFPGTWELGRKDKLYRNIAKFRRLRGADFDFVPRFFVLPDDWDSFRNHVSRHPNAMYIRKPLASSRGRGVRMVTRPLSLPKGKEMLVQEYVADPLLIHGHKFDLRIYVAVVCLDPLRIYVYREGLCRLASERYSKDPKDLRKRGVHVTNFSINSKLVGERVGGAAAEGAAFTLLTRGGPAGEASINARSKLGRERSGSEGSTATRSSSATVAVGHGGGRSGGLGGAGGASGRRGWSRGAAGRLAGLDEGDESESGESDGDDDEGVSLDSEDEGGSIGSEGEGSDGEGGWEEVGGAHGEVGAGGVARGCEERTTPDQPGVTDLKWSLGELKGYLSKQGYDWEPVWEGILDVVVRTVQAAEPRMNALNHVHLPSRLSCFELFGFDIMLDSRLKPWLIEVNTGPSLAATAPLDRAIKFPLLRDLLHLVGVPATNKARYVAAQKAEQEARLTGITRAVSARGAVGRGGDAPGSSAAGQGSRRERPVLVQAASSRINRRTVGEASATDFRGVLPEDLPLSIRETEAEHARRGDFVRAFPREDDPDRNHDLFDTPRYENELVRAWLHHKRGLLMRYGTVDPRELPRGHPDRVATRRAIGCPPSPGAPASPSRASSTTHGPSSTATTLAAPMPAPASADGTARSRQASITTPSVARDSADHIGITPPSEPQPPATVPTSHATHWDNSKSALTESGQQPVAAMAHAERSVAASAPDAASPTKASQSGSRPRDPPTAAASAAAPGVARSSSLISSAGMRALRAGPPSSLPMSGVIGPLDAGVGPWQVDERFDEQEGEGVGAEGRGAATLRRTGSRRRAMPGRAGFDPEGQLPSDPVGLVGSQSGGAGRAGRGVVTVTARQAPTEGPVGEGARHGFLSTTAPSAAASRRPVLAHTSLRSGAVMTPVVTLDLSVSGREAAAPDATIRNQGGAVTASRAPSRVGTTRPSIAEATDAGAAARAASQPWRATNEALGGARARGPEPEATRPGAMVSPSVLSETPSVPFMAPPTTMPNLEPSPPRPSRALSRPADPAAQADGAWGLSLGADTGGRLTEGVSVRGRAHGEAGAGRAAGSWREGAAPLGVLGVGGGGQGGGTSGGGRDGACTVWGGRARLGRG